MQGQIKMTAFWQLDYGAQHNILKLYRPGVMH